MSMIRIFSVYEDYVNHLVICLPWLFICADLAWFIYTRVLRSLQCIDHPVASNVMSRPKVECNATIDIYIPTPSRPASPRSLLDLIATVIVSIGLRCFFFMNRLRQVAIRYNLCIDTISRTGWRKTETNTSGLFYDKPDQVQRLLGVGAYNMILLTLCFNTRYFFANSTTRLCDWITQNVNLDIRLLLCLPI